MVDLISKEGLADPRDLFGLGLQKSVKNGLAETVRLLLAIGFVDPSQLGELALSSAYRQRLVEVTEALLNDPRVGVLIVVAHLKDIWIIGLCLSHDTTRRNCYALGATLMKVNGGVINLPVQPAGVYSSSDNDGASIGLTIRARA